MPESDRIDVVRRCYGAYESGDPSVLEQSLTDDFTFFSPPDPGIDRAEYFARCWPNAEMIESFDFKRLVESGDEVRRRLERALHEGAHQHVVALALKLRVACGRATPGSPEEALLAEVLADAMEASAEMGELARGLHPAVLSERGLAAALQVLAARSAVPVHLRELPGRRFAAVLETTAYLLVAEALANAMTHAHATECTLRAADGGSQLTIEVRDNGIGGAAVKAGGGLEALADRAAAVGGAFSLDSPRGGGTVVRLVIPVER